VVLVPGEKDVPSTSAQAASATDSPVAATSHSTLSFYEEQEDDDDDRESESEESFTTPPQSDTDRQKAAQEEDNKQNEKEKEHSVKPDSMSRSAYADYLSSDDSFDEEETQPSLEAGHPAQPQNAAPVATAPVSDSPIPTLNDRSSVAADYQSTVADADDSSPSVEMNEAETQLPASTTTTQRVRPSTDRSGSDGAEEEPAVSRDATGSSVRDDQAMEGFTSRRSAAASASRDDSSAAVEQRHEAEAQPHVQQPPRTIYTDTSSAVEVNVTVRDALNYDSATRHSVQSANASYDNNTVDNVPSVAAAGNALPQRTRDSDALGSILQDPTRANAAPASIVPGPVLPSQVRSEEAIDDRAEATRSMANANSPSNDSKQKHKRQEADTAEEPARKQGRGRSPGRSPKVQQQILGASGITIAPKKNSRRSVSAAAAARRQQSAESSQSAPAVAQPRTRTFSSTLSATSVSSSELDQGLSDVTKQWLSGNLRGSLGSGSLALRRSTRTQVGAPKRLQYEQDPIK
ncbi:hypothetical protein AAVH_41751, partial [Aphelenchoides avenae]